MGTQRGAYELRSRPRRPALSCNECRAGCPIWRPLPIAVVTGEALPNSASAAAAVTAFLDQAGCKAEHLRLEAAGVRGNGWYPMLEKNNREALQPILDRLGKRPGAGEPVSVAQSASLPVYPQPGDSTALKLADQGHFWVGVDRKKTAYGSIATGQMFVQYFIPAQVRKPYPIVLVHGGGGQSTHFIGYWQTAWLVAFLRAAGISAYMWWTGPDSGAHRIIPIRWTRAIFSSSPLTTVSW